MSAGKLALAATMLESARQSTDSKCVWAACGSTAEATLSRRPLCRLHFYEIASRRLAECSGRFAETARRSEISFLNCPCPQWTSPSEYSGIRERKPKSWWRYTARAILRGCVKQLGRSTSANEAPALKHEFSGTLVRMSGLKIQKSGEERSREPRG